MSDADADAELVRWTAVVRVEDAARARSRTRRLTEAAAESTTLAGVLADLAERARPVLVTTTADRRHHGTIVGIGADFVALRTDTGALVLCALAALASVRAERGQDTVASGRDARFGLGLAEALGELAVDRPRVAVRAGGATIVGELTSVGIDVVVIRVDGDGRPRVNVAVAAIDEVVSTDG